jgi:Uma2 family endonuclease
MATALERARKSNDSKKPVNEPVCELARLLPFERRWTETEYLELEGGIGAWMIELVDGRLEFPTMPNMLHQDILEFLFTLLKAFVMEHKLGRVYFAPMPVHLFSGTFREPDIAFLKSHRIKDKRKPPEGADLVMEIVSPKKSDRKRDLKDKRADYAKAKIPEYWIVDPEKKTITVLTLSGKSYRVHGVFESGDIATSKLLKGFKVAVSDVFAAGEDK